MEYSNVQILWKYVHTIINRNMWTTLPTVCAHVTLYSVDEYRGQPWSDLRSSTSLKSKRFCLKRWLQTSTVFWHFVSHSITLFTASCIFDAVVYIKSVTMVASVIWFRRFCVCRIWRKICYLKNQLSIFLWLLSINAMDFFYPKIKERFLIWWLSYQLSQWLGFDHCS